MFQIKKILFPVDFSKACMGASHYVEAFTGRFEAELRLLHVVDTETYGRWGSSVLWFGPAMDMAGEQVKWAREELTNFRKEALQQLNVNREVRQGDPGLQIVAAAREYGVDLIMMPTQGLSVFRRYIIGSITAKVLHDADCAVWTGAHLEKAPTLEAIEFPKVMCAVDMGPNSEKALRWAAGFAAEHSAELVVAHVVPASEGRPTKYFDQEFVMELSAQMRYELQALLETLGITARIIIVGGDPGKAVSEIARTENANQLIIARGTVTEGLGRLRTHAYAIIRSSPCPVVSV